MKHKLSTLGTALAACVPLLATAQATRTEPPKVALQLSYQSAFADYKPFRPAPLADWRALNETVAGTSGGSSGHAGHSMGGMKGMNDIEKAPAPAVPASAPMPVHDGHPKTGGQP